MSKTKYFTLKRSGRGPRETELNGTIIISREAEAEWDRKNERPTGALARLVKREAEARHQRAKYGAAQRKKKLDEDQARRQRAKANTQRKERKGRK